MRRVEKRHPPPQGLRSNSWPKASARLLGELNGLPPGDSRTQRARTQFNDELSGAHRVVSARELSGEQCGLCAFCERSVDVTARNKRTSVRVAHWLPVREAPERALDWQNIFASCSDPRTCDIHQKDGVPGFESPAERDWSAWLEFDTTTGAVAPKPGATPAFAVAVPPPTSSGRTGLWNLNQEAVKSARAAAMNAEREVVLRRRKQGRVAPVLKERIALHEREPQPFQSAVLYMLRKWLERQ